ncbi:DUF456 domain-containing protein [Hamadaea tsunoensis]|uniref:DUF456 domain-containing protein n=1 Tax=Hamadaea tsunoensis TaxID=53368 RepID=UPI000428EB3C|nr:DUF456 domain-containing protein [Hamadaea tsunoensis]
MDLTDLDSTLTVVCGLMIVVGVFGVVVPMLPGLLLCWGAVLLWAILSDAGWGRWVVLAVATLIGGVGVAAKYAWPGHRLKQSGVPNLTLFLAGVLGIVGFFVVPVVGLPLGFVLGIFGVEWARQRGAGPAWRSTKKALGAVGLSMLIELGAALLIGVTWVVGLIST